MRGQPIEVWILAAGAGALGALVRWGLVSWWHHERNRRHPTGPVLPVGVLIANTVAVLIDGVVAGVTLTAHCALRVVLVAGLAGGLSTLSTLAVDTVTLWRDGQRRASVGMLAANLALGALALLVGLVVGGAL